MRTAQAPTKVAFSALLLTCACGGGASTTPRPGGISGSGGAAGAPSASGGAGSGGTGGAMNVVSQCIFDKSGDPVARFEPQDVGIIHAACHSVVQATIVLVSDEAGQGFDWTSRVVPATATLTPNPSFASACAGYPPRGAEVVVRFPDDATPGQSAHGTLVIDTTDPAITPLSFDVNAELVETRFSLDPGKIDFGAVAIGQSASAQVTVTNLGTAPLTLVEPQASVNAPFRYVDWAPRGEDQFVVPTVPPGGKQTITVYFEPKASGDFSAELELSPIPAPGPPECGAPQPLALHGSAAP